MHARVTHVTGSTDDVDAGIANFQENVLPFTRSEEGCKGALLLADRATGKGLAVTLWESEQAMRASEQRADELRAQAAGVMGADEAPAVDRYEVAVFETR